MQDLFVPLDDEELEWLDHFLMSRVDEDEAPGGRDEGIVELSGLDGLLTAVVSGPNTVSPSRWLEVVWGDFEPDWESKEELEHFMSIAVRHSNGIVGMLMHQPGEFEPIFHESHVDGAIVAIVDEWCEGYMRGVGLDADAWAAGGERIAELLTPIRAFTEAGGPPVHELPSLRESDELRSQIALNVRAIHAYWLERRAQGVVRAAPARNEHRRVGRNDPCPCGSGRKFKHCCMS